MSTGDLKEFARRELESFVRRREERGRFYCALCLAAQLVQHGTGRVATAAWVSVIASAFERPDPLQVKPTGPCEVCQQPLPSIGMPRRVESDAQE
jgi:hypothetical protein